MVEVSAFQCCYNVRKDSFRLGPTEWEYIGRHPNRGSAMETETEGKKVFESEVSFLSGRL